MVERIIRQIIEKKFPQHGFMGEEYSEKKSENEYQWACDPIDGTWSFLSVDNTSSTILVLLKNQQPIVGIIYNPITHEFFQTALNQQSTLNGKKLPIAQDIRQNGKDLIGILNWQIVRDERQKIDQIYNAWGQKKISKVVSIGGSPAYALACVAKGTHSSYIVGGKNKIPYPWDFSAGTMLVRNAGGIVTDLNGKEINPLEKNDFLIASLYQKTHAKVLEILQNQK